ncbi:unnamed protein product [Pleuronectes platessa]|uniref:Uncharacterized protein n=1 Tax=Pleuronectes platessa TaxID=8262 RepID=A0A9N7YF74_PLEPL|nr:unnamed protein product [Pleuronectes platessa]
MQRGPAVGYLCIPQGFVGAAHGTLGGRDGARRNSEREGRNLREHLTGSQAPTNRTGLWGDFDVVASVSECYFYVREQSRESLRGPADFIGEEFQCICPQNEAGLLKDKSGKVDERTIEMEMICWEYEGLFFSSSSSLCSFSLTSPPNTA